MREWIRKHWLEALTAAVVTVAGTVLLSLPAMESASLSQMSLVSLGVSLMRFGVAALAVFLVLRLLDAAALFDWHRINQRIENNATAAAIYFGLRFLALAWLAAACLA